MLYSIVLHTIKYKTYIATPPCLLSPCLLARTVGFWTKTKLNFKKGTQKADAVHFRPILVEILYY